MGWGYLNDWFRSPTTLGQTTSACNDSLPANGGRKLQAATLAGVGHPTNNGSRSWTSTTRMATPDRLLLFNHRNDSADSEAVPTLRARTFQLITSQHEEIPL